MTSEILGFIMFGVTMVALLLGFPVAFTLAGTALLFAALGDYFDLINFGMLSLYPLRIFGIMKTETLVAVKIPIKNKTWRVQVAGVNARQQYKKQWFCDTVITNHCSFDNIIKNH